MSTLAKSLLLGALAAGATAGAALAADGPYVPLGDVQGWHLFINDADQACFMETETDTGLVVQMGSGNDTDKGYLAVFTKDKAEIANDKTHEITFQLGPDTFTGKAEMTTRDGYSGGYLLGNNPLLVYDLANADTLVVNPGGKNQFEVSLKGSKAALEAVAVCQAIIDR